MNSDRRGVTIGQLQGIINMARSITDSSHEIIGKLKEDAPIENPIEPIQNRLQFLEERLAKAEMRILIAEGATGSNLLRPFVERDTTE